MIHMLKPIQTIPTIAEQQAAELARHFPVTEQRAQQLLDIAGGEVSLVLQALDWLAADGADPSQADGYVLGACARRHPVVGPG